VKFSELRKKIPDTHFGETLLFTLIGLSCAAICSAYAWLFSVAEHASIRILGKEPLLAFVIIPPALILSWYLVRRFAPGAAGSGIPQVLASIEMRDENLIRKFLRKSVIVTKILSSFVAVFAGAAIGREGPSLQISAAVAYNLGKVFKKAGIAVRVEQMLVAGAAGGLAAAFNTPIGGIVYAIEELSKEHVRNFRDVLLLSVVIAGLTSQLINGNYLFLGYPIVSYNQGAWSLFLIVICSMTAGAAGAGCSKLLVKLIRWRSSLSAKDQLIVVGVIGLIIATTFYYLGSRHLYSGKESINVVLFRTGELAWYEGITRVSMPVLASMSGIAGGIFAPALSAGAALGGTFAGIIDPDLTVMLGLAGMIGFLTGITRTPITSFILVLEMTDRHSVVLPMIVAALCSSIGAHFFGKHSFYEEMAEDIKSNQLGPS